MKLRDLLPGMVLEDVEGHKHTFVAFVPMHPIWPELALVVWRRDDGEWFHDALSGDMQASIVGRLIDDHPQALQDNLRKALLHLSHHGAMPSLSLVKEDNTEQVVTEAIEGWMKGWRLAIEWLTEQGELALADMMTTRLPRENR